MIAVTWGLFKYQQWVNHGLTYMQLYISIDTKQSVKLPDHSQPAAGAAAKLACPLCWEPQASQQCLASHLADHRRLMSTEPQPPSIQQACLQPASFDWQCELCKEICPTDWQLFEHMVVCHSDSPAKSVSVDSSIDLSCQLPLQATQSKFPKRIATWSKTPKSTNSPRVAFALRKFLNARRSSVGSAESEQPVTAVDSSPPSPNQSSTADFKCFLCYRKFTSAYALDQHLLRRHAANDSVGSSAHESASSADSSAQSSVADAQTAAQNAAVIAGSGAAPEAEISLTGNLAAPPAAASQCRQAGSTAEAARLPAPSYACFLCGNIRFGSADELDRHLLDRHAEVSGDSVADAAAGAASSVLLAVLPLKRKLPDSASATAEAAAEQDCGDSGVSSDGAIERAPAAAGGGGGSISGGSSHPDDASLGQEDPELQQQQREKRRKQRLRCPVCCKSYSSQLQLNNHTYRAHVMLNRPREPGDRLPCPVCPLAYDNVDDLSVHMISHSA